MSPIERGGLQLYAGPTGDVAPRQFSFGEIDALAHHEGGSDQLGLVLLALTTKPHHGLRDLFDVALLDAAGVDLMHGCGRSRHPRRASEKHHPHKCWRQSDFALGRTLLIDDQRTA